MVKTPRGIPFSIRREVAIHSPGITLILRNPLFDAASAPTVHIAALEVALAGNEVGADNTVGTVDEITAVPIMIGMADSGLEPLAVFTAYIEVAVCLQVGAR